MRKKPGTEDKLAVKGEMLIKRPEMFQGKWQTLFGNDHPIYLELGCGKGQFITGLAARHPEINYVAVEIKAEVILQAIERAEIMGLENIRFIHGNVRELNTWFAANEVSHLYLNFSDPWPKGRHDKRRLTHHRFLKSYSVLLSPKGWVHVKTDNRDLFEFTLNQCFDLGLSLQNLSLDLHGTLPRGKYERQAPEDPITTEYEDRFRRMGMPIYYVEISLTSLKKG
jgi:tRNA (guanine-N7-)-methyltransferase